MNVSDLIKDLIGVGNLTAPVVVDGKEVERVAMCNSDGTVVLVLGDDSPQLELFGGN